MRRRAPLPLYNQRFLMCGIAGFVSFDGNRRGPADVIQMMESLAHRGPDDQGTHRLTGQNGECVGQLGHRRLSIIDLSDAGRQPMTNEDGRLVLVCNGEVYNYRDLRVRQLSRGHHLRSVSDSEVILHAYEDAGVKAIDEIEGMFAFALWDSAAEALLLVRDRAGIKPIYYAEIPSGIVFASELTALFGHPYVSKSLNVNALPSYLAHLYVPPPQTIWRGIYKIPPAHYLRFTRQGAELRQYWDIPNKGEDTRSAAAIGRDLWDLWTETVRVESVADVAVGVFLSGGLDSGALVPAATEHLGRVKSFTIGFKEAAFDEAAIARAVAERYDTEHHERVVDRRDLKLLDRLATIFDEPLADSGALANYRLSELASQNVKVVLSGAGGDEILGGYYHYVADALAARLDRWPRLLQSAVAATARRVSLKDGSRGNWRRFKRFGSTVDLPAGRRHYTYVNSQQLSGHSHAALYHPDLRPSLVDEDPGRYIEKIFAQAPFEDPVQRALYTDYWTYLPNDPLMLTDRTSMAHSLEVRVPFLNRRFVEFAFSIPSKVKLAGLKPKQLWRQTVAKRLPTNAASRPKQGFAVPVVDWFRSSDSAALESIACGSPYFDSQHVRRLFAEHRQGLADHSAILWATVFFEKWRLNHGG